MENKKKFEKNFLVTGASGFLGGNLSVYLSSFSRVTGQFNRNIFQSDRIKSLKIDLTKENDIKKAVSLNEFDWVIHCAAVTSPDECAKDRNYAEKTNVEATMHIVNYCGEKNIPVIYISTDLVFDGEKGDYNEADAPNPVSFYGETKLRAEQIALNGFDKNVVCRIALSYGKIFRNAKGGALDKMLAELNNGKTLNLFTDQIRTPLFSGDFCDAIAKLITAKSSNNPVCKSRIYHLGGADKVSRFEFGKKVISVFAYSPELINPVTMNQLQAEAKRGKDCSLNCELAVNEFGYQPLSIVENLHIDKKLRERP